MKSIVNQAFDRLSWVVTGKTGRSSLYIFAVMNAFDLTEFGTEFCAPYDYADFERCDQLIDRFDWRGRLHWLVKRDPRWIPYVHAWSDLHLLRTGALLIGEGQNLTAEINRRLAACREQVFPLRRKHD